MEIKKKDKFEWWFTLLIGVVISIAVPLILVLSNPTSVMTWIISLICILVGTECIFITFKISKEYTNWKQAKVASFITYFGCMFGLVIFGAILNWLNETGLLLIVGLYIGGAVAVLVIVLAIKKLGELYIKLNKSMWKNIKVK